MCSFCIWAEVILIFVNRVKEGLKQRIPRTRQRSKALFTHWAQPSPDQNVLLRHPFPRAHSQWRPDVDFSASELVGSTASSGARLREPWGLLSGPCVHPLLGLLFHLPRGWVSSKMSSGRVSAALYFPTRERLRCLKTGTRHTSTYDSGVRPFSHFLWSDFLFIYVILFPNMLFPWVSSLFSAKDFLDKVTLSLLEVHGPLEESKIESFLQ